MIESCVLLNAAGGDCVEDCRRLAEDPSLLTVLGHALPLPDAARKFLYAFPRDEAIATAKAQRPADQPAFIPDNTEPLQGLAHVNVELVRAVAARGASRVRGPAIDDPGVSYRGDSACQESGLLTGLRDPTRPNGPVGPIGFGISARMSPALAAAIQALPEPV